MIAKSGSPLDAHPSEMDPSEVRGGAKTLDGQRFEKISEIVKGFRKTCQYASLDFSCWRLAERVADGRENNS